MPKGKSSMRLLELMPVIWFLSLCFIIFLWLLTGAPVRLAAEGILIACSAALMGFRPWIQVAIFLAAMALISAIRLLIRSAQEPRNVCRSGILLHMQAYSAYAVILVRGQLYIARSEECRYFRPQCGDIVQIFPGKDGVLHFCCMKK